MTSRRLQTSDTPPRVNASKPPGEWQAYDIAFRAPRFDATGTKVANATFVKVVWNGQVVHEDVEVVGPTRGAMFDINRICLYTIYIRILS